MPLLESTEPQIQDQPAPRFPEEKPPVVRPVPGPAFTRALVEETTTGRLVGNIERSFGAEPSPAAQPGYNPVPDVPARHLADGHEYLHLDNPAQVAAKNQELDHRDANVRLIARTGKWGVAASMAAGAVDPMNIAFMALIPEAAPTRAGNAIRWALTNAGVSGTQELLEGAMGQPETPGEGLLNIGASAVLGGILGPLAPRIPRAKLDSLTAAIHEELHPPQAPEGLVRYYHGGTGGPGEESGPRWFTSDLDDAKGWASRSEAMKVWYVDVPEKHPARGEGDPKNGIPYPSRVELPAELADQRKALTVPPSPLGPIQRSVIEDAESEVRPELEAGYKGGVVPVMPPEEKGALTYVPPKPEGPTVPRPGSLPEVEAHRMSLTEAIAVSKGAEAKAGGLSYNEALAQGLDPADLSAARFGTRHVFTRGGASFDEMAGMLAQHGYPVVDEAGKYSPNALLDALDAELKGRKQYSTHAEDYLTALEEHKQASERADKGLLEPTPLEKEMELDAEHAENLRLLRQEAHALPGEPLYEPVPEEEIKPAYVSPEEESTAGAKAVGGLTKEDLAIARGGNAYSRTVGVVAPGAKLMRSSSTKVRQLTAELGNLTGTLEGNYRDIATPRPIEREIWKEIEGKEAMGIAKQKESYQAYLERVQKEGKSPLNWTQFDEEVGKAGRRNDRSDIPEAAEQARWERAQIKEPWHQRAKAAGMLKEEHPLFAESYQTRLSNMPKIRADQSGWLDFLRREFIKQGVDPAEATGIAHDVNRNIGASEHGLLDNHAFDGIVPKSGRLKARTLGIQDTVLEPWLVSSATQLRHAYLRTMVPEVLMTERFGTRDLADQFQGIRDEFAHLSEQARAQGDNERMGYLNKELSSNLETLAAVRDRLYGIYGVPKDPGSFAVRAGRFLRAWNIPRMLGGATFKHAPDLANAIQQYGAPQTFATMAKLATSLDAIRLAKGEAQRLGVSIDMVMNITSSAMWDAGSHSQYPEQRFMRQMNKVFTTITGETPLITFMQRVSSTAGSDAILRAASRVDRDIKAGGTGQVLDRNRMAQFASAGLDTGMLQRIAQAADRHGRDVNGLKFGMSEQWSDREAANAFDSAVARGAHGVTMRPGVLDAPLFMSKELGKFLFQFKSFEFAASRAVGLPLLQGLAHGDVRAMSALLAQFAMATGGYVAYQKATGGQVELNPKKLAVEVMDRTNLLGWTNSLIFPALYHAGFKDMTRWHDKDPISALGPSVELGKELLDRQLPGRIGQAITGQIPGQQPLAFRRSDMHFMRKMLPANQIWYARRTLDNLEDALGNKFNLPGKSLGEYRQEELENEQRMQ